MFSGHKNVFLKYLTLPEALKSEQKAILRLTQDNLNLNFKSDAAGCLKFQLCS